MKLFLAALLYLSTGANASDEGGVRGGRKLQPPFEYARPTSSPTSPSFDRCVRECKEDSSSDEAGGTTTEILLPDVTPLAKKCTYGKPFICPSRPTWCVYETCCDDTKPPKCGKELIVLFPDDATDRDKDEGDLVAPGGDKELECTVKTYDCGPDVCIVTKCCTGCTSWSPSCARLPDCEKFINRMPKPNEPDKDKGDLVAPGREKKPGFPGPSIIAAGPPRTKPTGGSRDAPSISPSKSSRDSREPTNSPSKSRGD